MTDTRCILDRYSKEHHYSIHSTKNTYLDCSENKSNYRWTLDGIVQTAESGVHSGLIRSECTESNINIQERIFKLQEEKYMLYML